jgi:sterol desaturase/sphingolipid hydroxylase (fatty acid hydroxylase superfamily)
MDVLQQWQQLLATGAPRLFGLSLWLLAIVIVLVPLERRWPLRPQPFLRTDLADDLAYYFIGGMLPAFLVVVAVVGTTQLAQRYGPAAVYASIAGLPFALRLAATLVIGEIAYYWAHRWSHEIPWLWRFHSIHHSPTSLDWLVNTRAHPLDLAFARSVIASVLLLVGLGQTTSHDIANLTALVVIFNTVWGFFIHANLRVRLGVFEHLITTPAYHHWHHANDGREFVNKNYAALLRFVDRLFGTHYLPLAQFPRRYGIESAMPAQLADQLLLPFRRRQSDPES